MVKKTVKVKKIFIITLIIVLVLVLARIIIFDSVAIAPTHQFNIEDYEEFYLYIKPIWKVRGLRTYSLDKMWFLAGQKKKMAEKIKEEVITELENFISDNNDILKEYYISDDFKKIYIYYHKKAWENEHNQERAGRIPELNGGLSKRIIDEKVRVYHELIHGFSNGSFGEIPKFVEAKQS